MNKIFFQFWVRQIVLRYSTKSMTQKENMNKLDFQFKTSCTAKTSIKRINRQATKWEKNTFSANVYATFLCADDLTFSDLPREGHGSCKFTLEFS